jgi:hypothetical protein
LILFTESIQVEVIFKFWDYLKNELIYSWKNECLDLKLTFRDQPLKIVKGGTGTLPWFLPNLEGEFTGFVTLVPKIVRVLTVQRYVTETQDLDQLQEWIKEKPFLTSLMTSSVKKDLSLLG